MISSTLAGRAFGPLGKSESARPNLEVRSAKSGRRSAPGLPRRPDDGDGDGDGRPNGAKTVSCNFMPTTYEYDPSCGHSEPSIAIILEEKDKNRNGRGCYGSIRLSGNAPWACGP
jgi:hypothetical protein